MCVVRAFSQASAEERKGRRKRTDGRVKPWSWTFSGGSEEVDFACEIRSLFFSTRRRFLNEFQHCTSGRFVDLLGHMVKGMKRDYLTNALVMFKANGSMVNIKIRRKDRE